MQRGIIVVVLSFATGLCSIAAGADGPAAVVEGMRVRIQTIPQRAVKQGRAVVVRGRLVGREGEGVAFTNERGETVVASVPDRKLIGTLVSIEPATFTLKLDGTGETLKVARESIVSLETRRGGSKGTAALIGACVGLAFGKVVAGSCEPYCNGLSAGVVLAVPGAALGALLGGEPWRSIPVAGRAGLKVTPVKGGVGASVSLAF